ncbi:MAG TPA: class II fructose-bisphosphate aldolase, partial [Methyloradius sp.]|nr:class II fructose-bisphosphate aldolase [Methyloradius sp.]
EGIKHGVRKVNIDTDLRMAMTGSLRQFFSQEQHKADFDPRKYLGLATTAMQGICTARYEAFGSAGWASKIKPISCEQMAVRYKKGELAAVIK